MILDKETIKNDFEKFLNSFRNVIDQNSSSSLVNFVFSIPEIRISNLTEDNVLNSQTYFYWKIESEVEEFFATDPIFTININGENRIDQTSEIISKIQNNFYSNTSNFKINTIPIVLGGMKFAPNQISERWNDFNDSEWFIPKYLFFKDKKGYHVGINILTENSENTLIEFEKIIDELQNFGIDVEINSNKNELQNPVYSNSVNEWENLVNDALDKIHKQEFKKVVLSREVELQLSGKAAISKLLEDLAERYPKCYTFAYKKNDSVFIGASPEKLARFCSNTIEVDALAGSAPRGESEIEDKSFEDFLLTSEKNINEQQAVVSFITNLLKEFTEEISFDKKPIIRKLPNIQHLWTIIKANLREGYELFDVLKKLHPTPAICGTPWDLAQKYILENEPHDRGLYSGNIGWFNFNGTGEFAVAIRSALIKENKLFAYAGCGIVEGSEAKSEFEESEIKLKPILSLFVDEKIYQS